MEVQALHSIQLQALEDHSCKFYKQGMQQFSILMKYKNVFFIQYDSRFRFEVFELLLRLWSGQAKRNRVFEIRKPGRCFIQKKKKERGREEKKPYSCVWLKNKTAALSEPLKSPSPVIVSRHLQLEAARMFVVVLKASECGFHMVYFYFGFFFSFFFPSPLGASSSWALPYTRSQPTLFLHELSVKELSEGIVALRFKRA